MIEVGVLWKGVSSAGQPYLSGPFGSNATLLVFPNTKKEPGSKSPDYRVMLASKRRPNGGADAASTKGEPPPSWSPPADEIPF